MHLFDCVRFSKLGCLIRADPELELLHHTENLVLLGQSRVGSDIRKLFHDTDSARIVQHKLAEL